jgi:hypothetical protein
MSFAPEEWCYLTTNTPLFRNDSDDLTPISAAPSERRVFCDEYPGFRQAFTLGSVLLRLWRVCSADFVFSWDSARFAGGSKARRFGFHEYIEMRTMFLNIFPDFRRLTGKTPIAFRTSCHLSYCHQEKDQADKSIERR